MTSTEQDKLRELVHIVQNADTTYDAIKFITSDRKRVALEARIDELSHIKNPARTSKQKYLGLDYTVEDRLAELKAQQEEV